MSGNVIIRGLAPQRFAYRVGQRRVTLSGIGIFLLFIAACGAVIVAQTRPTSALTTVPTKMNFQGRLTDSAGNVKANGTYNMRLRLYTVSTGGSAVWSEDRLVSASQGVTVTNGLFSIKLGDVTTLPASLFASGDLYLSVELPSPATATSSSPSWTEGAMTPRNQMATSAYAYNAETLDGLDSAAFARTDANNTLTGTQTVNVASTAAFDIQNGSAVSVLKVDTVSQTVSVGNSANTGGARLSVEGAGGSSWTARAAAQANQWKGVAYGNGMYVAVSSDGTNRVMTSPDGITWTARTAAEANAWEAVTYGNGQFVAVAQSGTNRVMTSPDGITWTARAATEANTWWSVTYGNGLYVAVSRDGTNRVMTSPDGATWTARTAAEANSWRSVTYSNGQFVAVSSDGTNRVMTSPDGITWTARAAAQANAWHDITFGNGLYVAVSNTGANRVMTSPDGITWTARTAASVSSWIAVTYGNGQFAAVADSGNVMTSLDGITWTARTAAEINGWNAVTYGNSTFVAVATTGTNRVMTSRDVTIAARGAVQVDGDISVAGNVIATANNTSAFSIQDRVSSQVLFNADTLAQKISVGTPIASSARITVDGLGDTSASTWTSRTAAQGNTWRSVTYGNNLFVAVSNTGTNRVMTSPDGVTWTARTAAQANSWESVTYGNGLYVAVSPDGTNRVMTSPDGITWTARSASEANQWQSVTYGNGLFVAVSNDGTNRVMTSPDGITWTARSASEANSWQSVTYGNSLYVAVSPDGTNRVMTSPNGITWTARAAAEANQWQSVTYGNGLYVAVSLGGTNRVMTSPDGITWTARSASEASSWRSVAFGNNLFTAVAESGTNRVMTSPDGITWTSRVAAQANTWVSVTYGKGMFVAVSPDGTRRVMTTEKVAISTGGAVQVGGDVAAGGNVTSAGLTVANATAGGGYVATIANDSTDVGADGLLIRLGIANASRTVFNYFVGFADSTGTVAGKIQGGASAVAYTTTAADYAEYFKADPANMPQPGEIVALDHDTSNGVKLASGGQTVMGVVSTNPGFVGNGPLCDAGDEDCDANYAKTNALVSLVGQVPVKVTGEVKVGDMLGASEIPGRAKKVTSGSYVGYALTTSVNGIAQVLIRPGTLNTSNTVQGGDATFTGLVTSGVATVGELTVTGDAQFKGNLTVHGTLETSDIIINGHLMAGGAAPSVTAGTVLSHSSSELSIEGTDGAGTVVIKSGGGTTLGTVSHLKFAKQYAGSYKVVLSPVNGNAADLRVYVVKTADGFDIITKDTLIAGERYEFDYIVVGVKSSE